MGFIASTLLRAIYINKEGSLPSKLTTIGLLSDLNVFRTKTAVVVIRVVVPVVVVSIVGDSVCSRFVRKTFRRQVLPQNCDGSPEHG